MDWVELSRLLPEDGDRIQSPKRCVLKNKEDGVSDIKRTMDNVQKHNIYTNVP
jgi:Zn-finger protein